MKLSCPSCGAKYSIADEKVHDRLAKIRCRKCSATIIVDGKVSPPSVYTSEAAAAPDPGEPAGGGPSGGNEYSVDFGDNDQRTMTTDDIAHAYHRGELSAETYVWAEGFSDWQPISAVPELLEALGGGGADSGASAPRAAARTGSGRGSAHDLFGGIATAGSEEDVMTSAPQAAAPAAATTGARNESSVLFSLSALTASAPATPSISKSAMPSAVSNGKDDDSGLIDLKALTSSVSNQAPTGQLVLGTAPLGMAAPLGGMTAPAVSTDYGPSFKPASSKTGIYIAAAMVLVGALIAGAIVVTGNKEAPAAASPPVPVAPVPAPTAEVKKEEPTAAPPATGTAEAAKDTAAKATPKATAHYAAKKPSSSSASLPPAPAEKAVEKSSSASSDTSSDAPKKPKKPKEKTCNCGPGDLMCAMKCAAS